MTQKRCEICHDWFAPQARAPHQRCCSKPACRKKRKAAADKKWWLNNPNYGQSRKPKIQDWARNYPDYWQKYRREHPDYVGKERRRRRSAHQKAKNAAKQDAVRQIAVEKLESIRDLSPNSAAKQDEIAHCLCRAP